MAAKSEIVMTPTKRGRTTVIKIEKKNKLDFDDSQVQLKAGGEHSGLVINKQQNDAADSAGPPHLQLEFKCFLVDQKTGGHVPERRVLKFWFVKGTDYLDKVTGAYEFFKELVKPDSFPRDYVGFIKKVMKQMQDAEKYPQMDKVDVEMEQIEMEGPPPSPGLPKEDTRPREVILQENLLRTLEHAYPNVLQMEDLMRLTNTDEHSIMMQLGELKSKNLIKEMDKGGFTRLVIDETGKTEVKEVKQMSTITMSGDTKPSIAIITALYCEKLAVDAMMENKTTFVRYKTEGESNVYTIGYIGNHKVISTKLPAIGRQRAAQISSGNTTTRLLGTFGDIEHVFLVGVGGGVPHFADFHKHVRLGDVVISRPNQRGYMYIYCDKITQDRNTGQINYMLKSWGPHDMVIQKIGEQMIESHATNPGESMWMDFLRKGQEALTNQQEDFSRPHEESDKLYMNVGGQDVIEVAHPPVPEGAYYNPDIPTLRAGTFGAGKPVVKEDALRQDFAVKHDVTVFDSEYDQVLESIVGNRKDSFVFIRGIADYTDGAKSLEWQPYSALAAASVMKEIICQLPNPFLDE